MRRGKSAERCYENERGLAFLFAKWLVIPCACPTPRVFAPLAWPCSRSRLQRFPRCVAYIQALRDRQSGAIHLRGERLHLLHPRNGNDYVRGAVSYRLRRDAERKVHASTLARPTFVRIAWPSEPASRIAHKAKATLPHKTRNPSPSDRNRAPPP